MRKSFKKGFALVLAAALAFSTPVAVNGTVASAAEGDTEVADQVNPTRTETITGTGWWDGPNENSSKYYIGETGSAEFYVTNTDGGTGIVIEAASVDGAYFDVNMQGTGDGDMWGDLIDAATKPSNNNTGFPALGTVKVNLTREGTSLHYVVTDVDTENTVADLNFTLTCPADEVLGFYAMATDGAFKVAPYMNPTVAQEITGTDWWDGPNENSAKYYIGENESVDIYATNTAGGAGVVLEAASADGKYFDANMQGTGDADIWGELIDATTKPANNSTGFPALGTVKITLTREGTTLHYVVTNLATEETVANMDFTLTCPQNELLGFYLMATDGSFKVGPTTASIISYISDVKAGVSEDGSAIQVTAAKQNDYDNIAVKVNGTEDEEAVVTESEGTLTYSYVPAESGNYEFEFVVSKEGYPSETKKTSIDVVLDESGKIVQDQEMIANLKATKAADAYSITFDKLVEDADYKVEVQGSDGKAVAVDADNNVKFADLVSGTKYTVKVTATKAGYVEKTATTEFEYTADKVEDAGKDVKRTMINKTLGATDFSTAFWSKFESFQIEDSKKYTFVFENHSSAKNVYNNYVLAFANQADFNNDTRGDKYVEYAIVRADNFGWIMKDNQQVQNTSLSGKAITFTNSITDPAAGSEASWAEWKEIIKDSDVTMNVIRSGSEIKLEATIVSQADKSKKIDWTASLNVANADQSAPNPLYMAFTVDGCYLNLKYVDEQVSDVKLDQSGDSTEKPKVQNKSMMINKITAKVGAKKVTGTVNAANATVEVKVGKAAYKKATVSGKNFTLKTSKLKIGTKITVKATAEGYTTATKSVTLKGTMKLSGVKAKKGAKKVTGKVSVKKATVKVKVGKKKYKKAKVSGKKFTFKTAALKKGTKVTIKVTKKNYKTVTKSVKVK